MGKDVGQSQKWLLTRLMRSHARMYDNADAEILATAWAKKARRFWDQITLQQLMIERRVICKKF